MKMNSTMLMLNSTATSNQNGFFCDEEDRGYVQRVTLPDLICTVAACILFVCMVTPAYIYMFKTNPFSDTSSKGAKSSSSPRSGSNLSPQSPESPGSTGSTGSTGSPRAPKSPSSKSTSSFKFSSSKQSHSSHKSSSSIIATLSKIPTSRRGKTSHLSNRKDNLSWYLGVVTATLFWIRQTFDTAVWFAWISTLEWCVGSPTFVAEFGLHALNAFASASLYLYFIYRLYSLYQQSSGMFRL